MVPTEPVTPSTCSGASATVSRIWSGQGECRKCADPHRPSPRLAGGRAGGTPVTSPIYGAEPGPPRLAQEAFRRPSFYRSEAIGIRDKFPKRVNGAARSEEDSKVGAGDADSRCAGAAGAAVPAEA